MLFLFAEVFIHLLLFPLRLKKFYNPGQITGVLGPETIIKKRDNDYGFPSAGYFERFLK